MSGFFSALTIVLIVLKLSHTIDWSWFWVLSPPLAWFLIFTGVVAIALVYNKKPRL